MVTFYRGFSPEVPIFYNKGCEYMPKYKTFQYSIKQYGKFNADKSDKNTNFLLLKARIGIRSGDTIKWVYSSGPTPIKGKREKLRLTSNKGERIIQDFINLDSDIDKIRIKTNFNKEYIYSERGWG